MGYVGTLGRNLHFFVSIGIPEILGFSELSVHTEIVLLKILPYNTLNYASTANIEEVMKFYNLDHKTFETDFNLMLKELTEMIKILQFRCSFKFRMSLHKLICKN